MFAPKLSIVSRTSLRPSAPSRTFTTVWPPVSVVRRVRIAVLPVKAPVLAGFSRRAPSAGGAEVRGSIPSAPRLEVYGYRHQVSGVSLVTQTLEHMA